MNRIPKEKVFLCVSLIREAKDSGSENYEQHSPNPRLDLVSAEYVEELLGKIIQLELVNNNQTKRIVNLEKMIKKA